MSWRRLTLCALLIVSGCGKADDGNLRQDLQTESTKTGLALVRASAGDIVVIPFNGHEMYFQAEYRFPISVFGKAGHMILWWFPRGFFDMRGEFVIDSISGERVATGRPPMSGFSPLALSETAGRIAFWGTPRDKNPRKGLYWTSFDFSESRLIGEGADSPDWSPDGGALVYEREKQIYVFDVASSSSRLLVVGHDPTWSPNGKWIAFLAPDGRASLVTPEGLPVSWPLSVHQPISAVRWSPDGRYVSFSERVPYPFGLMDVTSQLVVCRVSNGNMTSVRKFGSMSVDYKAFYWIIEYREFCGRCTPKEAPSERRSVADWEHASRERGNSPD